MAEPSAADGRRPRVRRREHESGGPRATRIKVSYNDAELTVVNAAADRDNQALASWVGSAALDVAKEKVVPVSVDAREVIAEFIRARLEVAQAREQVARIGNNVNQIARVVNADGTVPEAQAAAVLHAGERTIRRMEEVIRRMDEATRQVMRERRPRR